MSKLHPPSESEACEVIARARNTAAALSISGGGTRATLGRPTRARATLSTSMLTGITFFEPNEMVISARAGTPVSVVDQTLAEKNQMLPFEPMDHRRLVPSEGAPTIAGVFAANISGPARINRGACRDAAIGVRLVNGRGEVIKSGGRVVKNVTGLDLTKLTCGSFGTLGLVTEVTFKVIPRPERSATLLVSGLSDVEAIRAMSRALGSPYDPTGAAHLPPGASGREALTLIRIANFSASVEYRLHELSRCLRDFGDHSTLEERESESIWQCVRDAAFLAQPYDRAVWRISTAPQMGPVVVVSIQRSIPDLSYFYDWGGGLVWISVPANGDGGARTIRAAIALSGGHATLVRAPAELRAAVDVFQPLGTELWKITAGLKASFDPDAILEPGRMYAGI